jgi:glycosyltransferase involved in cell wall biosynthesis
VHFIDPKHSGMNLIAGIDMFWNSQREFANPPGLVFAMQQAIPVISVLCEETSDLILPLQTGLATNFGSRDEFARWTKYLIEIPAAASTLGMQGKRHVENMLTTKTMVDGYQKLYADL